MPLPASVPHDVYPLSFADETTRELLLTFAFVFPLPASSGDTTKTGVVDPVFLRDALFRAIAEKLPRAGGRLAKNPKEKGSHDVHVPREFTPAVPPAGSSLSSHPTTACPKLHSLSASDASRPSIVVPLPSSGSDAVAQDLSLAALFRGPAGPTSLRDLLQENRPVVHLHLAVYADKLLAGVTVPHAVFDAASVGLLVEAWASATRGELGSFAAVSRAYAPLLDFELSERRRNAESNDAAPAAVVHHPDVSMFHPLGFGKTLSFVVRFIWTLIRDPREHRVLFRVPKTWAKAEKRRIITALVDSGVGAPGALPLRPTVDSGVSFGPPGTGTAAAATDTDPDDKPWVSTNDVLAAHAFRWATAHHSPQRAITLHSALNLRLVLPALFAQQPTVSNVILGTGTPPLPLATLRADPPAAAAWAVRRSINAVKEDPEMLKSALRLNAEHIRRGERVYPCEPAERYVLLSSWTSARLGEHAFRLAAGADKDEDEREAYVVRPEWVTASLQETSPVPMRNTGAVFGHDDDAYWIGWWVGRREWRRVERVLRTEGVLQFVE